MRHECMWYRYMCVYAVALRNVCELLEFADMYNATQLKTTCLQFITLNLPALLESRWCLREPVT